MQIRGLHRSIYRGAHLSSRLDAQASTTGAARRDGLLRRWQQARRSGLTAQVAADVLGEARASLYRWQKQPSPKSTRPPTVRKSKPEPKLALAVECLRKQHPMWGKDKLAPLLWKQDFDCSVSKVGRILKNSSNAAPFNPCRFCAKARNMRPASTNGSMPYAC